MPTAGEKRTPNSRWESKEQKEECHLQAETCEENNVSKNEVGPMTRNKDTESHRRMVTEQELKFAEKAREHQVEIEEEIEVDKQKAAESKGMWHRNNSWGSKQIQIAEEARSIAAKEAEERKHEIEFEVVKAQKPSLQQKMLTERNQTAQQRKQDNEQHALRAKEYVAKVEAQLQKIYDDIFALMDKNLILSATRIAGAEDHSIGRKDCRSRRPSAKDAQKIIHFERVDHEQIAEKRQAASQAKNDANLAKQSDMSKNTQHNVK